MSDSQDEYWALFQEEGLQTLQTAEQALLTLEQSSDLESLQALYRAMHTLKGNCGMMGLPNLSNLTHKAEDLTESLKLIGIDHEESPIDLMLGTFDLIQENFPIVIKNRMDLSEEQISPYVLAISRWLSKYAQQQLKTTKSDHKPLKKNSIETETPLKLYPNHPLLDVDMQEVFIDTFSSDLEELENCSKEQFSNIIHAMQHSCTMMKVEPVLSILKSATYELKEKVVFQCTSSLSDIISYIDAFEQSSTITQQSKPPEESALYQEVRRLVQRLRNSIQKFNNGDESAQSDVCITGELLVQQITSPRLNDSIMRLCVQVAESAETWIKEGEFLEELIEWEREFSSSNFFEDELCQFHAQLVSLHISNIQEEFNSTNPDHKKLSILLRSLQHAAEYSQQPQASMLFLQLSDGFERYSYGEPVAIEEIEHMLIQLSNSFSEVTEDKIEQQDFNIICTNIQMKIEAISRGNLAQEQVISLEGIPPNILEALTEESYQHLQHALEEEEQLYLIEADLEASEFVTNEFSNWIASESVRLITSGTLYIEDRTEFAFLISTNQALSDLEDSFFSMDKSRTIIRVHRCGKKLKGEKERAKSQHFKPLSVQKKSAVPKRIKAQVLRVKVEKISSMMDLAGEIGLSFGRILHNPKIQAIASKDLKEELRNLQVLIRQLQDATIGLRLIPISEIFQRMNRVVRDASQSTKKKVHLILEGEDTELDKMMVERLHSPLIHLIRNCIDHGIESPEEREQHGKEPVGVIVLKAKRRSSEIHITIQDDGRGLDREKIEKRAREKGIILEEEPDPQEVEYCIFKPGFSTADVVTKVSGRGMGMDIVKMEIDALRGSIELSSEPGKGTAITLILPLTVAFISAMVSRLDTMSYAFPLEFVKSVQYISEDSPIQESQSDGLSLEYQHQCIPIYGSEKKEDILNTYVLLLQNKSGWIVYPVDELPQIQQVVIKPLTPPLHKIPNRSSFGLLPNGELAMVIDVESLRVGS